MYPVLLEIGSVKIESYFVIVSIAITVATIYALHRSNKFYKDSSFYDLAIGFILSIYLGGRIFHIFFEEPNYYIENPIEILKVWKGGFVVFGSIFFATLFSIIFMKVKKMPILLTSDIIAPSFLIGMGIGRIACFLAGCCYGKKTSSIFGVIFPHIKGHVHPTQLYMSFSAFFIFFLIIIIEKFLKKFNFRGLVTSITFILFPLSRFFIEYLRDDFRGYKILSLTVSQFFSIIYILFGFCILLVGLKSKTS